MYSNHSNTGVFIRESIVLDNLLNPKSRNIPWFYSARWRIFVVIYKFAR
jgi:hypothetical protein